MSTITINLPEGLNVPANWDAQSFFISKMYEAGILLPEPSVTFVEPAPLEDAESESWFTPEQIAQFKENRRRLDEEWAKNPPPMSREEFTQHLLNGPVATDEEIQTLEEIQEMRRQWKSPW